MHNLNELICITLEKIKIYKYHIIIAIYIAYTHFYRYIK